VEFPEVAERVFLLSEMEGKSEPVEDPYGGTLEEYRKSAGVIDQMIQNGLPRILELVEARHEEERRGA
jgi:protein-tyrosine-phosphatase